jgi:biotin operon repressor
MQLSCVRHAVNTDFRKLEVRGQGGFQWDNVRTKFHEMSQLVQNLKRERHRHIHKQHKDYLSLFIFLKKGK